MNIGLRFKNLVFSLVTVSLLFIFTGLFVHMQWGMNDDVRMAQLISGKGMLNGPTEYIIDSNILVGVVLKKLYLYLPSYPWYGIYSYFVLFLSFVLLLFSLLNSGFSVIRLALFLGFFSLYGIFALREQQFTVNAFMSAMSGVFLWFSEMKREEGAADKTVLITAAIMLIISSIIRVGSFLLIIVLSFVPTIFLVAKSNFRKQLFRRCLMFYMAVLLSVSVLYGYDAVRYAKDDKWIEFAERGRLNLEMVDNNWVNEYSPRTIPIFEMVGWSQNDLFLLQSFCMNIDEETFSKEKMQKVLSFFKKMSDTRPTIYFDNMLKDQLFYSGVFLMCLFIPFIGDNKRSIQLIAISVLLAIFIILYLGYYVRLPQRVYLPIQSFLCFLSLYHSKNELPGVSINGFNRKWTSLLAGSLLSIFIVYCLGLHYAKNVTGESGNRMLKQFLTHIRPLNSNLFFIWPKSLDVEYLGVFDNLDNFAGVKIWMPGYTGNNARKNGVPKGDGLKTFSELIAENNFFHIGNYHYMALFTRFMQEHYNTDIAFKMYEDNPLCKIYKHTEITPEMKGRLKPLYVKYENSDYFIFIDP